MLAACALGWMENLGAAPYNRVTETLRPRAADRETYDRGFTIYTQVYKRLRDLF